MRNPLCIALFHRTTVTMLTEVQSMLAGCLLVIIDRSRRVFVGGIENLAQAAQTGTIQVEQGDRCSFNC
jgi:hypothetical protein